MNDLGGGLLLDRVKLDDLNEVQRELAEVIGLDAFKKLVRYMGGCLVYVPKESCVTRVVRDRLVRSAFRGDYKSLAKIYRLSEGHVRRIVNSKE